MTNGTLVAEVPETSLCCQRGSHPASSHTEHTLLRSPVHDASSHLQTYKYTGGHPHTQYLEDAGTQHSRVERPGNRNQHPQLSTPAPRHTALCSIR